MRRNIEKVSQLLGVVEPEKVRKSSRPEHLERDAIALAKLVMKEGEKPGKFLLPHGIILLELGPYRIFMEGNPEGIQNQRPLGSMELSVLPHTAQHFQISLSFCSVVFCAEDLQVFQAVCILWSFEPCIGCDVVNLYTLFTGAGSNVLALSDS